MGRLGIRYDVRAGGATADPAAAYAAILDHAERAEGAGVDVIWVAERPFAPDALLPAAFPLCAALAQRTERARIATGVIPLPLHHPLRVAEDTASLDVVSGGRAELGVGLGAHAEGFDGFGVPLRERAGRLEEAVAVLVAAWGDAPVHFDGRHFTVEGIEVHPKPVQRPHPPLWIAARAPAAVSRAARLGAGLLTDALDAAGPFLAACAGGGPTPRVAWLADPAEGDAGMASIEAGLASLAGAEVDLVVPARPEAGAGGLEALAALAEGLRPAFARHAERRAEDEAPA